MRLHQMVLEWSHRIRIYRTLGGDTVRIGDLVYDVVTESMWIIIAKWWCPLSEEDLFDIVKVDEPDMAVVINEDVIAYMRADFLKRT